MRERLTEIQDKLDSRLNELIEYALATAELHGYVSRVVAKRKSAWEVAAEIGAEIYESGRGSCGSAWWTRIPCSAGQVRGNT